jgi:DNA-binding NarL/FixJ family response regulator
MTGNLDSIRVVIADEHATFRQALRMLLERESDLTIVGEASDANGVRALARQFKPDVVLIDVALFYSLRGRAGTPPAFRMLVTVPTLESVDIIKVFLNGARAVVPRHSPAHVWCESIRAVGADQYWLVKESIAVLVQALQGYFAPEAEPKPRNNYRLTPREVEIIDKIAQGHSNKEVGKAFSICERTVKHHLTSIFTKVGVSSRLELALFVVNHRLLETPPAREAESAAERDPAKARRNTG